MSRLLALLLLVQFFPLSVCAQPRDPVAEVAAGYAATAFNHLEGVSPALGVGGSVTFYLNSTAGLDFQLVSQSGEYTESIFRTHRPDGIFANDGSIRFSHHLALIGPRMVWRRSHLTTYLRLMAGVSRLGYHRTLVGLGPATGKRESFRDSGAMLALGVGGGIDLNLNSSLALRLIGLDFLPVRSFFGGHDFTNNLLMQSGVVFRLGQR